MKKPKAGPCTTCIHHKRIRKENACFHPKLIKFDEVNGICFGEPCFLVRDGWALLPNQCGKKGKLYEPKR